MSFASGSELPRWKICCSVLTTACTGPAAGSLAFSRASIAVAARGVGQLGLAGHQRADGGVPSLAGCARRADAAATASPAR